MYSQSSSNGVVLFFIGILEFFIHFLDAISFLDPSVYPKIRRSFTTKAQFPFHPTMRTFGYLYSFSTNFKVFLSLSIWCLCRLNQKQPWGKRAWYKCLFLVFTEWHNNPTKAKAILSQYIQILILEKLWGILRHVIENYVTYTGCSKSECSTKIEFHKKRSLLSHFLCNFHVLIFLPIGFTSIHSIQQKYTTAFAYLSYYMLFYNQSLRFNENRRHRRCSS